MRRGGKKTRKCENRVGKLKIQGKKSDKKKPVCLVDKVKKKKKVKHGDILSRVVLKT